MTYFQTPGRMNIFDGHPFKVILDYGHNPAAIEAMCKLVERLEPKGKRIVVLAAPGDRRDEDVREIARIAAGRFDHYIVRRDDNLRGRKSDEIPNMLHAGLIAHGVAKTKIQVIPDEQEALAAALSLARQHDLVLAFGDAIARCWKQITSFESEIEVPRHETPAPLRIESPAAADFALEDGGTLVRDERGVRIARESED
jgi:cyanophycin synthetase